MPGGEARWQPTEGDVEQLLAAARAHQAGETLRRGRANDPERKRLDWAASMSRGTNCALGAMTARGPSPPDSSGATPHLSPLTASKAAASGGSPL